MTHLTSLKPHFLLGLAITLALVLLTSLDSRAQEIQSPRSKEDLCKLAHTPEGFQQLAQDSTVRMAFSNHGGLANGGVCWWHSRFQRAAIYLTLYRPDLQKPTAQEAKNIINAIKGKNGLVTIPGYRNFNEFSHDFADEIQVAVERWQKIDGFLKFKWIIGLSGSWEIPADQMRARMDKLYQLVAVQKKMVFQMLQLKGIVSHAWNVIGISQLADGYDLYVIDSNLPLATEKYTYRVGDTSFHSAYGNFVPYTEESRELAEINRRFSNECQVEIFPSSVFDIDDSAMALAPNRSENLY